ncbi:Smr/MutS family protein [Epibacterium ulvae]|uniref:DNA-nicking endonuclease, Smr domain n=1 Tax=Epibacterium ulvae TaxID=1156985 RepID=A0A1G5RE96_9RHOB|nr:Smr/MutS family protein [Epibacterium ulvae]SCZ72442.1 DNA-nicking endonuclease, Smr domain [Epibacterium ulvae]
MTRRKLTEEELDLWKQVARQTERLHPERPSVSADLPTASKQGKKKQPVEPPLFEVFKVGSKATPSTTGHRLKPAVASALAAHPVKMDDKAFRKLKRGKLKPEGKLDLHGMRIDTAHPALTGFILRSHAAGKRLVLVVTGKGKDRDEPGPIPVPRGVLRHNVPQWLALPPLVQVVLQVTPAHISHGGDGAYYVYLRRSR